ncbi:MAG: precorrin-3B synthase [Mycobacteriaceae bacterium]
MSNRSKKTPVGRTNPDRCPGVLELHPAADGGLARIRVPGGLLNAEQVAIIALAARELGNGTIELTSRANIQLRGIAHPEKLAKRLMQGELFPSATHERVRNIISSPLSGRVGGSADISKLVKDLDTRMQSVTALADLSGRFLISIDDGSGDVSGLGADIGLHLLSEHSAALLLAGKDSGVRIPVNRAVQVLIDAANVFVQIKQGYWRLSEVPDGSSKILSTLSLMSTAKPLTFNLKDQAPIGWIEQINGKIALGAGVRFGQLDARTLEFLAAAQSPLILTPWKSLLLVDLSESAADAVLRVLAPRGLIFDAHSPWLQISTCTGSPGCAKSLTDVRSDAQQAVLAQQLPAALKQHWVGCERACGRPAADVELVVATDQGYRKENG